MPTARRFPGIQLLAGLATLCALFLYTSSAAADDNAAAVAKIGKANKKALHEYENLNFDQAQKILKDALDLASKADVKSDPVVAQTYVYLGVVTLTGFKQTDDAIELFRKAIQIQPDIKLDKALATPEIQQVFDQAAAAASPPATPQKAESANPTSEGLNHTPITRALRGSPVPVRVSTDSGLGAKKVVLTFKADGAEDFSSRTLKEDPPGSGNWYGEIPSAATQGGLLEYYIEVLGDDDNVVAANGTGEHTLKVALVGPSQGSVAARRKPAPKAPPKAEGPSWYLGLGVGSGFGYTTGYGEVNNNDKINPPGFAPSSLGHIAPEIGYFVNRDFLLSLQLRFQYVSGATSYYAPTNTTPPVCGDNVCTPAWYALAGFARANFLFGEGDFRPYITGTLGLGQIRHVAEFASITNCGPNRSSTCTDTVAAGPVFLGGGGGLLYNLTPSFGLTLGANLLVGFTTFTFHVDINAGIAAMF